MLHSIYQQWLDGLLNTSWIEGIAVVFGIISVLYSRAANVLVYPTGLVNTTLYIYLCMESWLFAEASVNFYYTIMSIIGWYAWADRRADGQAALAISRSSVREWWQATGFAAGAWLVLYLILACFTKSTVPVADAFASATAYTAMWLMTRKKTENWIWWIITNFASIPLYFSKGLVFTSFQYIVFLLLAILGLIEWNKKLREQEAKS